MSAAGLEVAQNDLEQELLQTVQTRQRQLFSVVTSLSVNRL